MPERVDLDIYEDTDGVVTHRTRQPTWPKGTEAVARALDELDVPLDESANQAQQILRDNDRGRQRMLVQAAQRYRRQRDLRPVRDSEPPAELPLPGTTGTGTGIDRQDP